jgi:hypothetical protein
MEVKRDSRGITLIELIVAISLTTVVLLSAYFFLSFAVRSMKHTEAEFIAGEDARMAVLDIVENIRNSQSVTIGLTKRKAVEVDPGGMSAKVYVKQEDGTLLMVQYKLEDDKLKKGEATPGGTPASWSILADRLKNAMTATPTPIFTVNGKRIGINLLVIDDQDTLIDSPVGVTTSITVRSKGAMD